MMPPASSGISPGTLSPRILAPTVSVIIPVFNRAGVIGAALRSVFAQTFRDFEVIVVDDASHDDLKAALQPFMGDPCLRLVRQLENGGVSAARNRGMEEARGRFIAFLDSDDLWLPEKLAAQVAAVEAHKTPLRVFCITLTEVRSGDGSCRVRPERVRREDEQFDEFLYCSNGFAQASSFFLSRALALECRFNVTLRQYEDHLFFIAAGAHGADLVIVGQSFVVWHDDDRADRLGSRDNIDRARQFLFAGKGCMSEKAAVAFEASVVGPALWRDDKKGAVVLFFRAFWGGSLSTKRILLLLARCIVPTQLYTSLRRRLMSSQPNVKPE